MCVLMWLLLCVLMGGGMCGCMTENYTLHIEKSGCNQCVTINTTICSGFCHTQDTNVKGRVGRSYLIQRGCMPHTLVHRAARVPGCPLHISPLLYFPEVHRCHCTRCDGHAHRFSVLHPIKYLIKFLGRGQRCQSGLEVLWFS
uniref:Glycoprotein hormone subunit beta domain-containing protein n=1 Tax=Esox lucius TaxID=8010 RepID=A0AAY5KP95_ESOLU